MLVILKYKTNKELLKISSISIIKYTDLPNFWVIINTTNTSHYGFGKFWTRLLNPLTQIVYSIKDSFEAIDRIHSIPTELFYEGYLMLLRYLQTFLSTKLLILFYTEYVKEI